MMAYCSIKIVCCSSRKFQLLTRLRQGPVREGARKKQTFPLQRRCDVAEREQSESQESPLKTDRWTWWAGLKTDFMKDWGRWEYFCARTRSMTRKESMVRQRERAWRRKKNRHAVLTLRQDWVEQETALHCKDKRKGQRDREGEGKVRGNDRCCVGLASLITIQRGKRWETRRTDREPETGMTKDAVRAGRQTVT